MESKFEVAQKTLKSIKRALEESRKNGIQVNVVFIPSELRYVIAAFPNDALSFDFAVGETIYDVPLIRYISDDMSMFFLGQSYNTDGSSGNPAVRHRPFYGMRRKEQKQ